MFTYPVRVYYEDTDAGGVVYYANYLKFFERARTEMLRHLGFEQDRLRDESGIVFVVRSVDVKYLRPALFNDLLQVTAEVSTIKKVSLNFQQAIQRDQVILCTANIEIACVNIHNFRVTAIPDYLVEPLKNEP